MNLVKRYMVQSISAASNNLRLNSQQIEVVALLRETIVKSKDLQTDLLNMKRVTELSTLAIRLNEVYNYLTQGKVDFFKISEQFREHSQFLIRDLSRFLEQVSPQEFKIAVNKLYGKEEELQKEISIDLSKRDEHKENNLLEESASLKEELIMHDENSNAAPRDLEEEILKPVKPLDALFKKMEAGETVHEEIEKLTNKLKKNAKLLQENEFELLYQMHKILIKALHQIKARNLMPGKDVVQAMRACLIVVVAIVRGKEVDITDYLNRAERFGKKLSEINNQVAKI